MSIDPWKDFLTERDRQVFAGTGFGKRAGFGRRPAVVVVDVNYNFVGDRPEPITEVVKRWPLACGEEGWVGMKAIKRLLTAARAKRLPVYFTTGDDSMSAGGWARKNDRMQATGQNVDGNAIPDEIAPEPGEVVIKKLKPSAFFGTPLIGLLTEQRVDSLLVTGTTTSGCVHATVVDGFSYNLHCTLVAEGCFDRGQASHAMAMFNMQAKYADLVGLDETVRYINSLPDDVFGEPQGKVVNF